MTIDTRVLNFQRDADSYNSTKLFLGPTPGLFDTIHRPHEPLNSLFKELRVLDWDEVEFDYSQCLTDFETCPAPIADMMIKTLAWQWEGDSLAARSIISTFGPFISSSALWRFWSRVTDNENLHAATYSEIVRMSFKNPSRVLEEILAIQESQDRLKVVGEAFSKLYSLKLSYETRDNKHSEFEYYKGIMLGVFALLNLERNQFMGSFPITFGICGDAELNSFQPIGKAVQKIAQDELEIHCEGDKRIFEIEAHYRPEMLNEALFENSREMTYIFEEVVNSEVKWLKETIMKGGRYLSNVTEKSGTDWILYNGAAIKNFGPVSKFINTSMQFPNTNPLPFMADWLNMNKLQPAPQEQDVPGYKVGAVIQDDDNVSFDEFSF